MGHVSRNSRGSRRRRYTISETARALRAPLGDARRVRVLLVVGFVAAGIGIGHARVVPQRASALAKSKAAAKSLGAQLKCWQKAIAKGSVTPDAECLAVADEKLAAAIAKVDAKGGCIVSGDASGIGSTVDACVEGVVASTPGVGPACTASTTRFGDAGALAGTATFDGGVDAGASDDFLKFDALLEASQPADGLTVSLFAGYGVFQGGAITPGVYQLTGAELDFATCGVCVRLATNRTGGVHDDDYMATGGTVTVTAAGTAVGQTLSGALSNVTFHRANIDASTGVTTLTPDVCTSAIASATFGGTLQALP